MKTDDILALDCSKKENKELINKFLWKVKPVARILEKNHYTKAEQAPIELLEQALHGICERYSYKLQHIWTYTDDMKFKFYHMGIIHVVDTYDWKGDVDGKTLWEIVAKAIIKIYAEIKKKEK